MSVTKQEAVKPKSFKDELWGIENISKWLGKLIFSILFFFTFYMIIDYYFNLDNSLYQFIAIFCSYILADAFSFFAAYVAIKAIFGFFFKRRVKPFYRTIKNKMSRKKIWIYFFAIMFETIFYSLSLVTILVEMVLVMPIWVAYLLVWTGLWLLAKGLGAFLYFVFYSF